MRLAKRLGLPGLIAILLVVGGLLLGGSASAPSASAQIIPGTLAFTGTKSCAQRFTGGVPNNAGVPLVTDCTLTLSVPLAGIATVVPGATTVAFTDIMLDPNACFVGSSLLTEVLGGTTSTSSCTGGTTTVSTGATPVVASTTPVPSLVTAGTACVAPGVSAITGTTAATATSISVTCTLPPIVVVGPTNLCEEIDLTVAGATIGTTPTTLSGKIQVCPPNPPVPTPTVNPLSGVQVTKTCTPSFAGASANATKVTDCTLVFTTTTGNGQFNNGTTLEFDTITAGNAVFSAATGLGEGVTTNDCENGVGNGGVLSSDNTTFTCVVGPIIVSGATTLCETVQIRDAFGNSSAKLNVCPTGSTPTPTNGLNFTVVKNCTTPVPNPPQTGGVAVTDCTLVFTPASGTAFPGDVFVADDTITSPGVSFSSAGAVAPTGGGLIELTGTAANGFCQGNPSTGTISGFTLTCALPPIVIAQANFPSQVCETVELGSATLGFSSKTNVCGFSTPTPTPASALQPTDENKICSNTTSTGALSQTIGGTSQALSVSGPAKSFTLPLFSGASTCVVQLYRGGNPCNLTDNRCADGNVVITLTTVDANGAVISCSSGFTGTLPSGFTVATNNGGSCQTQSLNTQLNIGCGVTANTPSASTTVSNTCTNVLFDIQSALGACVNTPQVCFNNPAINSGTFNGFTATVTVQFLATPANGGTVGGIQLGTNTFNFAAPGIGTLLVTASPQLIPSNGTLASVVSATFACTTGFNLVNGLPLSNSAVPLTVTSVNGVNTITANSTTQCGAGLPGTFTFSTPGPVLFDNGRSQESITCGPNANVNAFGNGQPALFAPIGSTFPLAFTCTGAAVLAIGAGAAGDAPINVTYQSAVGGLQAVGSTLITVSPSGVPRISVACNPSTISAGSTGSLCTATVTDINGVPLSGITGATVTFTSSDPANATILPCVIGTPGAINVTTSPQVIPLIQPTTPCVTPSSTIPGQVNTFVNGQATALLVASPTAHPETVTVTASLGVLVPPSFACLVSPYVPTTGFGLTPAAAGYYTPAITIGNPNYVSGCGTASPIGTTGLATALNVAGGGLTGIVTLPNTTSASTTVNIGGPAGIQIAGATPISPLVLSRGCNSVVVTSYVGTPIANIAALVTPANAVVSIWRFSNSTKLFNAGFFSDPNAPTDFALTGYLSTTNGPNSAGTVSGAQTYSTATGALTSTANQITETYYVCVNQQATMISG